jgi:hypothetical protein
MQIILGMQYKRNAKNTRTGAFLKQKATNFGKINPSKI